MIGAGIFYLGYRFGKFRLGKMGLPLKSVFLDGNADSNLVKYCLAHSTPLHPVQQRLINDTVQHEWAIMMGAPEVMQLNMTIIKTIGNKTHFT
jgi:hypothetical protein